MDAVSYMMSVPREEQEKRGRIRTYLGKLVDPLNMRAEDIDIRDIAHHLSNICRYTGAVPTHYSVAQHSVLVSQYFSDHTERLAGLLHDASEAYMNDLSSPMKHAPEFAFYREREKELEKTIFSAFGLDPALMKKVKPVDDLVYQREVASFWGGTTLPVSSRIIPVRQLTAEINFLREFRRLVPNWDGYTPGTIGA